MALCRVVTVARRAGARAASTAAAAAAPKPRKAKEPVDRATLSPIRGLFYGDLTPYAKHCQPYPSGLSPDQKETLGAMAPTVAKAMASIDSSAIDAKGEIPTAVLTQLAEMGLFGLQIDEALGGLGLNNTGYARIVEEVVIDPSIGVTLMAHQSIGLKGILLFGTPEQKARFLPKLASGEQIAAFALTEPTAGSDAAGIKLSATRAPDNKGWLLNGSKMWISNGGIASVYTVFAKTPAVDGGERQMTAFIVTRDPSDASGKSGVRPGPPEKKLGIRGSNTCVVNFDNAYVPDDQVLGQVGGGFKVAMQILNNGRFGLGCAAAAGMRKLVGQAAAYANERQQFGRPIASFGLIQEKFAQITIDAYVGESMGYMTTALLDGPKLDMSIEAAACKVWGSEKMAHALDECIQITGGVGFASGVYPFERLWRDARILRLFEGTNEILRLMIALMCIRGPGEDLAALAAALRRPGEALTAGWSVVNTIMRASTGIGVHPVPGAHASLAAEAAAVGRATAQFQHAVQTILTRHGKGILEKQLLLARIADMAIDLYGCLAVISRATASLNHSGGGVEGQAVRDHELLVARTAVRQACGRLRSNLAAVLAGEKRNGDASMLAIANDVLKAGKYIAPHPLGV